MIADIAAEFHQSFASLEAMPLERLFTWHNEAVRRSTPEKAR